MTPDCSASGLRMLNVRSTAMSAPGWARLDTSPGHEPQRERAEQQLDVLVGEVEPGADEVVAAADDARPVDRVVLPCVEPIVDPCGHDDVIEKVVVGVHLQAEMLLERVGEFEGVGGNDEVVPEQVQLGAESAGPFEDAEAAADVAVALRQVRAELQRALRRRLIIVAREESVRRWLRAVEQDVGIDRFRAGRRSARTRTSDPASGSAGSRNRSSSRGCRNSSPPHPSRSAGPLCSAAALACSRGTPRTR